MYNQSEANAKCPCCGKPLTEAPGYNGKPAMKCKDWRCTARETEALVKVMGLEGVRK